MRKIPKDELPGRCFDSLEDLNRQIFKWLMRTSDKTLDPEMHCLLTGKRRSRTHRLAPKRRKNG
jgi:hypothetical protein